MAEEIADGKFREMREIEGSNVESGQKIGVTGTIECESKLAPHLHFAVKHGKAFVWFAVHFKAPPRRMETLLIAANAANHL